MRSSVHLRGTPLIAAAPSVLRRAWPRLSLTPLGVFVSSISCGFDLCALHMCSSLLSRRVPEIQRYSRQNIRHFWQGEQREERTVRLRRGADIIAPNQLWERLKWHSIVALAYEWTTYSSQHARCGHFFRMTTFSFCYASHFAPRAPLTKGIVSPLRDVPAHIKRPPYVGMRSPPFNDQYQKHDEKACSRPLAVPGEPHDEASARWNNVFNRRCGGYSP